METLLSKYLGVVDLIVVALCAIFAARATATVIESSLMNGIPAAKHVARPLAQAAPAVYTKQVEEILKRNIFCSTCPPILAVPVTPGAPVVPDLQRTSLPLKLLAIMFAPPPADPRWSMAIIRDNDAKTAGPYAIGSKLREATVSEIDEVRVYLDFGGGRIEYLELLDRPTPPPGAPAPVAAAVPAEPAPPAPRDSRFFKRWSRSVYMSRCCLRLASRLWLNWSTSLCMARTSLCSAVT